MTNWADILGNWSVSQTSKQFLLGGFLHGQILTHRYSSFPQHTQAHTTPSLHHLSALRLASSLGNTPYTTCLIDPKSPGTLRPFILIHSANLHRLFQRCVMENLLTQFQSVFQKYWGWSWEQEGIKLKARLSLPQGEPYHCLQTVTFCFSQLNLSF